MVNDRYLFSYKKMSRSTHQDVPLKIPSEANPKFLTSCVIDWVFFSNWPIQFTLERMKDEIYFVEKQNTLFEQLEDLCAIVHIFWIYIQLCYYTLFPEPSGDSG